MIAQSDLPVGTLRSYLTDEIVNAIGLSRRGRLRSLIEPLFWAPAQRFAELAASFDRRVSQTGFCEAARWVLPRFVKNVEVFDEENIPAEGPLIIASNHPGTIDSLAIAANLPRSDLKIIASGMPFMRGLSATARFLIYAPRPPEIHGRMNAVRQAIRHLLEGGSLLIFPSGGVDPDPEVLPGAQESLTKWSSSVEILLKKVPQAKLVLTIVSGVLSPACLRHPLTRLRKGLRERQLTAEIVQIVQLMILGKKFNLTPRISFARPVTLEELGKEINTFGLQQTIIARARHAMTVHLSQLV